MQLVGGVALFIVRLFSRSGSSFPAGRVVPVVSYHAIMVYFLYSVASYYSLVRKQKKTARNVLRLEEGSLGTFVKY